jgi:TetR/AcrR family transcriptional repressor of nem operon
MRYSADHKAETHARLLRAAAAQMRRAGMDGVSVAEIMRGAGLTHGGFYAHFTCKDDLIAQAVTQMFADNAGRVRSWLDDVAPARQLGEFIARYLSPIHRDRPDRGCPLTTIATDMPRQSTAARRAFDAGAAGTFGRLEAMLPADLRGDRAGLARSVLSEMAGAVALSRAVSDRAQSDDLLAAVRVSVRRRCGLDETEDAITTGQEGARA